MAKIHEVKRYSPVALQKDIDEINNQVRVGQFSKKHQDGMIRMYFNRVRVGCGTSRDCYYLMLEYVLKNKLGSIS